MFFKRRKKARNAHASNVAPRPDAIEIRVVGVGGGGGNAVRRMADDGPLGVRYLVLNTDVQALKDFGNVPTFAIGPNATNGMGSGGQPEIGRKAMRESSEDVSRLLDGADMAFIAVGMGGGTGTGAAAAVADVARKRGALTVGVATLPFEFEGPRRRENAERGIQQLRRKVDTLIVVENDRLLPALDGDVELERAFRMADDVLRQGIQGISDIITVNGMINVDFADVKAIMSGGGAAFMAIGSGAGCDAATQAAESALANPLFDMPLEGAKGVLLNVTGGPDLTLGQVHEVAGIIKSAASENANVIFGVVQDERMKNKVSVTLVGAGVERTLPQDNPDGARGSAIEPTLEAAATVTASPGPAAQSVVPTLAASVNGRVHAPMSQMRPML